MVTVYTKDKTIKEDLETLEGDIRGTMRLEELGIELGRPEVQEVVVEVTPRMDKVGPHFKRDAPRIVTYLQSHPPEEVGDALEADGKLEVEELEVTPEFLEIRKEVVGKTGEKVDIIRVESLDLVVEIVV